MFWVCDKKDNRFGVLDTDDGICEYYTESELYNLAKQARTFGVSPNKIEVVPKKQVLAQAKILGLEIRNVNWFKDNVDYRINLIRQSEFTATIVGYDKETNIISDIFYPISDSKHLDLLCSKFRIENLYNSIGFSINQNGVLSSFVLIEGIIFISLKDLIGKMSNYIKREYKMSGYIDKVYRPNRSIIAVRFYTGNTYQEYLYYQALLSDLDKYFEEISYSKRLKDSYLCSYSENYY